MRIDVLDHGFVRLVSYTQPVRPKFGDLAPKAQVDAIVEEYDRWCEWSGDLEVVRNARVSFDADWRTGDDEGKDAKLLSYMVRNRHTSPFEAMVFTFEVKCPIFVARQWHRHRTWSYNEVSARYAELPEEFYVPAIENVTTQSASNKQARTTEVHPNADLLRNGIETSCRMSFEMYRALIAQECPRELARGVLPTNTYTRFFATVDLHNLFHFLSLRLHEHAQWEIRQYASALLGLVRPVCPVSVAEFEGTLR